MTEFKEEICRKLRATVKEFGRIDNAIIISTEESTNIGGHTNVYAPTVSIPTLGNVEFKTARFFEEV